MTVSVGQTSIANVTLLPPTAIRAISSASGAMRLYAGAAGRLVLELPKSPLAGRVRVYDVRGAILFAGAVPEGMTRMEIPWTAGRSGYMVIERGGEIHRLTIAPAR